MNNIEKLIEEMEGLKDRYRRGYAVDCNVLVNECISLVKKHLANESQKSCDDEFLQELNVLWKEIVLEDDNRLTLDAIVFKRKILEIFKKTRRSKRRC